MQQTDRQTDILQIYKKHKSKPNKLTENIANKKYFLLNADICPIVSKVGQVTLATPPFGVIHHRLYTT